MERLRYLRPVLLTAARNQNAESVESAIFYQILGYSSAAVHLKREQWQHAEARYWMNGVLHTFPICWGLHTTGLGLCWQGSASQLRGRSKA